MNTQTNTTRNAAAVAGHRIRHPHMASIIEECLLMQDAGSDANLILLCGPTGVGKTTLGYFLVEAELKHQAETMAADPGYIPAIRVEAPASGEKEFSWRLFYQRILNALEGELDAPRTAYGVDPATGKLVRPSGAQSNRLSGLRTAVERSIRNRGTRFIVVDEAAHMMRQCRPNKLEQQLDTLKSLSNEFGVQWILLGSYDLFELATLNGQLTRRSHVIHFGRYREDVPEDVCRFPRLPEKAGGKHARLERGRFAALRGCFSAKHPGLHRHPANPAHALEFDGGRKRLVGRPAVPGADDRSPNYANPARNSGGRRTHSARTTAQPSACSVRDESEGGLMMQLTQPPRSTLHALAPQGLDTPDVESLTSYVCRLAHSHGMTSQKLVDWILDHFEHAVCDKYGWHQRNLSSMSSESEQWSAWLSELTGVESLDRLTLAPYHHLLGMPGLAPRSDRWCPCCFSEDRQRGEEPYLRLAWDIAPVEACLKHKVKLTSTCPHCQRSNVRNRAAIVVPGYCTACGGFLGEDGSEPATPESLWTARQVGNMLVHRPQVASEGVVPLLETVIERMADGKIASFASSYGFSKSGVWHWLRKGGLPGIKAWLTIALHGGIGLDKLFAGEAQNWEMPHQPVQLSIALPESPRAGIQSRELDWEEIRASLREMLMLPTPISINEAGNRVGVGRKHLYLRANAEARAIADRHSRCRATSRQQRDDQLRAKIGELLDERLAAGYEGISARDIWAQLDAEAQSVSGIFHHISLVLSSRDG